MKTPQHLTYAISKLYKDIPGKASLDSAKKRDCCDHFKDAYKVLYYGWNGGRCDMEGITRLIAPSHVKVCRLEYIENFKKRCELLKGMTKSLKKKTYNGDRHTQNYVAAGVALTPNCSANSAQTIVACVRQSLFHQYSFEATEEEITQSSVSSATVTNSLANLAASCLNQQLKLVADARYIFGAYDKGHRAGVDHFVKMFSFFNRIKQKTQYFVLDMDCAGNSDKEAAKAVFHSMDQKEVDKCLSGQTTDNGGGATLESFYKALQALGITNPDFYFVANCTLHNLSLAIAVPVEKVFGLGGVGKVNFMQMLHSIYDLQKFYGSEVWRHIMETEMAEEGMEEDAPNKMPQPVTTRWWWLGISCEMAIKYWKVYVRIAKATVNVFGSSSYGTVVASSIDALMKEELFYGHTVFVECYSKFLINPHFEFLQSRGFRSKAAAFNSEGVLVRLFLMYEDFDSVLDGRWKEHPAFTSFNHHLVSPRWMTVEQGRKQEKDDETRRIKGPKEYGKKAKQASIFNRGIDRELKKKKDLLDAIVQFKGDNPASYWISLSQSKTRQLDDIMALFGLNNRMFDPVKGKNRAMKRLEKEEMIAAMEPIEKDAFDYMHYNNITRIMKLELRQKEIDFGLKETLYETIDNALPDQLADKIFMNVPLRVLFMLKEYEALEDGVTENSIREKKDELKEKIATIKSDIELHKQKIKDRDPLPEDDDEELASDNDVDQQQQQEEELEEPPPTEERTEEEIDIDYKNELSRQATIFIGKGFELIEIHFKRWVNDLIFFGIASEPPTSSMVANLMLGQPLTHHHNTNTYHSPIHNREINLEAFAAFLQDTCKEESLIEQRDSYYFKKYMEGIKAIANGEKLWESSIPCVKELREFVEDTVLAIASNQQFVELAIKECMNATCLNRSVAMKSVIGIIRSYLNREKAEIIEEVIKTRPLHANQHTEGGIKGERIMKNKTKEQDLDGRYHSKGCVNTIAVLKCVTNLNKSENADEEQKILRLSRTIKSQQDNYERQAAQRSIKKYDEGRNKTKKINDAQKRREVHHTPFTTGRISFKKLYTKNMPGIKEELTARQYPYSEKHTIKELRDLLMVAVKNKDHKQKHDDRSFHPRTETLQQQFENSIRYSE